MKNYFIHKNKYLIEFLLFCYIISWLFWGLLFFINKEKNIIFYYFFLYLGALTPGIFILIKFKYIKNLIYKSKLKINFLFFLILSLIIPFFCFYFVYIIWNNFTYLNTSYYILFNKIFNKYFIIFIYPLFVAFLTFFEEIGFRAFFQYNLKMNNIKKSLITGFIWGLWHLPLNLTGYNFKNFPIIGNLMFIISCILISYITYFLLIYSKNIFICSIYHASNNVIWGGFTSYFIIIQNKKDFLLFSYLGFFSIIVLFIFSILLFLFEKTISFLKNIKNYDNKFFNN